MKNCIILIIAGLLLAYQNISGQGCIAVRSMSCASGSINNPTSFLRKGDFQLGMSYRYLHSYKHFVGKEEQTQRVAEKTNVINTSNNFDLGVTYAFSDRFNFAINLPVATNVRSSLYEHYGNSVEANPDRKRFNSGSAGVGDMRFTGNYWLLDPAKHHEANFSLGLSLKMPTGNPNVTDQFHKRTKTGADSLITKYVDQSIQLGDSGWGYGIESQGFSMLGRKSSMYYNLFYLLSPKILIL